MWGGTGWGEYYIPVATQFQSTLPVWGGTADTLVGAVDAVISIHPPRVGRDMVRGEDRAGSGAISIHPPRVGRDYVSANTVDIPDDFNPPSPCGEGRYGGSRYYIDAENFNPPSPCGEGRR